MIFHHMVLKKFLDGRNYFAGKKTSSLGRFYHKLELQN